MLLQRWMVALYVSLLMLFGSVKAMAGEEESFDHTPTAKGYERDVQQGKFEQKLQFSLDQMLQKSAELMKGKNKVPTEKMLSEWALAQQYLALGGDDDIVKVSQWLLGIWNSISVSVDGNAINKYRLYGIKAIADGLIYVLAPENSQEGFDLFYKHYNEMSGPISWWITYAVCKQVIKTAVLEIVCSPAAGVVEGLVMNTVAPKTARNAYEMALRIRAQRQGN